MGRNCNLIKPRSGRVMMGASAAALTAAMALLFSPNKADAITGVHFFGNAQGTVDVCVMCHVPHRAPKSPLLWNHVFSANNYSWSDWTQTTGGTNLPTNIKEWSGSSKMCLSCHDGSVAIDALYYTPPDLFPYGKSGFPIGHGVIGAGGNMKGHHPIAMPYPYNGVKNTYNGITTGDDALKSGWVANPTRVKIYTDPNGGANNRGIECSSCHDVHTGSRDYPGGRQNNLRDTLAGSQLCLDCHTK